MFSTILTVRLYESAKLTILSLTKSKMIHILPIRGIYSIPYAFIGALPIEGEYFNREGEDIGGN